MDGDIIPAPSKSVLVIAMYGVKGVCMDFGLKVSCHFFLVRLSIVLGLFPYISHVFQKDVSVKFA